MTNVRTWKRAGCMALGAALLVGAGATRVAAHAGDGDTAKIHACVHKKNGKVRFVGADPSIACKGNENALHFNMQGAAGPAGQVGTPGREGRSALTPLAPGETVSGVWGASVTTASAGAVYRAFAAFPIPLETDVPEGRQIYVPGESAPNCPGRGRAAPGYLCLYQGWVDNAQTPSSGNIFDPSTEEGLSGASRFGFGIYLQSQSSGVTAVSGTFSVTAP
ncbi:MAG: hypothetical protein KIT14_01940 [bacterium]|nr:hypothetical protein [bacterium]